MRKYGELKTKYEKIKQEVTQLHNFLQVCLNLHRFSLSPLLPCQRGSKGEPVRL